METVSAVPIAAAAEAVGVSAHTLRYYERIGLLDAVPRRDGGQRAYTPTDLGRAVFVTRMRATGMPIVDLQRYVALVREGDGTEAERRAILEGHRARVRANLADLETCLDLLDRKIDTYRIWKDNR